MEKREREEFLTEVEDNMTGEPALAVSRPERTIGIEQMGGDGAR